MLSQKLYSKTTQVDISDFKADIYLITVLIDKANAGTQKFIKKPRGQIIELMQKAEKTNQRFVCSLKQANLFYKEKGRHLFINCLLVSYRNRGWFYSYSGA